MLLAELSRAQPDTEFCVLSERPEEIVAHYGSRYAIEALPHPTPYGWKRMLDSSLRRATRDVWRAVRESQLFVLGGGSLIRDHNKSNFTRLMDELHVAQGAAVRTAVIGVTVGPLTTGWGRFWSRRLLRNADVVAVRDEASEQAVAELARILGESASALHQETGAPIELVPFRSGVPEEDDLALCEEVRAAMVETSVASVARFAGRKVA